jgi:hypothetical protein
MDQLRRVRLTPPAKTAPGFQVSGSPPPAESPGAGTGSSVSGGRGRRLTSRPGDVTREPPPADVRAASPGSGGGDALPAGLPASLVGAQQAVQGGPAVRPARPAAASRAAGPPPAPARELAGKTALLTGAGRRASSASHAGVPRSCASPARWMASVVPGGPQLVDPAGGEQSARPGLPVDHDTHRGAASDVGELPLEPPGGPARPRHRRPDGPGWRLFAVPALSEAWSP